MKTTSLTADNEWLAAEGFDKQSAVFDALYASDKMITYKRRRVRSHIAQYLAAGSHILELNAGTGEDAQAEEAIVASLRGEDIVVAFNPTFLSEGLNSFTTDFVRFSFTSAPKPAMLTGQKQLDEADQDQYRYLVMPVRLPNSN